MRGLVFIFILFASCNSTNYYKNKIIEPSLRVAKITDMQKEIDDIFSLLIFSLVFEDWQEGSVPRFERRGYNIGALIVDKNNNPVQYDLNCINATDNATQHGEVRAITHYLEKSKSYNLAGHTIYTTLEPCVMCAGMITMTSVKRIVYGQHDVEYSKAFERLAIDTREIGGFAPYPRKVESVAVENEHSLRLDKMYRQFLDVEEEKILAKFLVSDEAKDIFKDARNEFLNLKIKFADNIEVYKSAVNFLKQSNAK